MEVSVLCLAYNHEKYIRKCLDSILSQKTKFDFEIIINDDASYDKTADIIKEYESKYPQKLKAIYQKENKYSKGEAIIEKYMLPKASGKYIAFCECDDWWLDDEKLQKQYEYMESNQQCSLCGHNTLIHCINESKEDSRFNTWNSIHVMNPKEIYMEWDIHTSSFFMRKEDGYRFEYSKKYWFGDYVRLTQLSLKGDVVVLPQIMSQYNYGVKTGALYVADNDQMINRKNNIMQREEYLQQLLKYDGAEKYKKIINERILLTYLEAETILENDIINNNVDDYKKIRKAAKSITKKKEYKRYLSSLNFKDKVKNIVKYKMYEFCPSYIIKHRSQL